LRDNRLEFQIAAGMKNPFHFLMILDVFTPFMHDFDPSEPRHSHRLWTSSRL
jgi:hypothetical protein